MRVVHVPQHPQRLPDPTHPVLEHLLTKGRGANWAAEEAEATSDNRNLRWQGGRGGVTIAGDEEEGLLPVEMEDNRGALRLHNVESSREVPRGAHQGAVVEVPGVQGERGYLSPDTLDDRVES